MNRGGELAYTTGKYQRRLIRALDAIAVVSAKNPEKGIDQDPRISEGLARIEKKLHLVVGMQEKLQALYKPQSMATLADKHTR